MTWPIAMLLFGLGLMVAEIFLPTGGLLGMVAAVSLAGSLYLASAGSGTLLYRWAGLEAVAITGTWFGAIHGLPRTKLGRRVYLQPPTDADLEEPQPPNPLLEQVGRSGRALTPLRPSGTIDVAGRRLEAMAESGLIEAGAPVTVIAVRSGRAIVRAN